MTADRFFVVPEAIQDGNIQFNDRQAHQIKRVLRLGTGDRLVVLDNSGWQYLTQLTQVYPSHASAVVLTRTLVTTEPRTKLTIYQGLLKANRFEFVVQKCTELGITAIVPTICDRCIVGNITEGQSSKIRRWEHIVVEAAEQSGRGKLPLIHPAIVFQQACETVRGISLIAWEAEEECDLVEALRYGAEARKNAARASSSRSRPFSVNLFVGPEGGFSDPEIECARSYGIVPVTLGRRLLRAETAAVVATALVLYEMGDLG